MKPKFKPQNAQAFKGSIDSIKGRQVVEPKFDGIRQFAETSHDCGANDVDYFTRTPTHQPGSDYPLITQQLNAVFPADTILDGEFIVPTAGGGTATDRINEFSTAAGIVGSNGCHPDHDKLVFIIFDLLQLGGHDARSLSYEKRRELLDAKFAEAEAKGNLPSTGRHITLVTQFPAEQRYHDGLVEAGWEGSIVKDLDARYASGKRGHGWLKVKPVLQVEGVIMGFQDGKNGFAGLVGAIKFGQYKDGKLIERGKVSGIDMELRQAMTNAPDQYIGRVMEVLHEGVTKDGRFRFPRSNGRFRDDKAALDVDWHDE